MEGRRSLEEIRESAAAKIEKIDRLRDLLDDDRAESARLVKAGVRSLDSAGDLLNRYRVINEKYIDPYRSLVFQIEEREGEEMLVFETLIDGGVVNFDLRYGTLRGDVIFDAGDGTIEIPVRGKYHWVMSGKSDSKVNLFHEKWFERRGSIIRPIQSLVHLMFECPEEVVRRFCGDISRNTSAIYLGGKVDGHMITVHGGVEAYRAVGELLSDENP